MTTTQRLHFPCSVIVLCTFSLNGYGQLLVLHEPLEDPTGSNLSILGTDLANSIVIPGFDYATGNVGAGAGGPFPAGIPEAPHTQPGDAARTGLFMAANVADGAANQVAAAIRVPTDPASLFHVSGSYTLEVDVWMNFAFSSSGTTEHGGVFIGHDGINVRPTDAAGFAYTGNGGFTGDYILFKGTHPARPGDAGTSRSGRILSDRPGGNQYDAQLFANDLEGDDDFVNDNSNILISNAFCSFDCSQNPNGFSNYSVRHALEPDASQGPNQVAKVTNGAAGFRWMTIKMDVQPNTLGPAALTNDLGVATVSITSHQRSFLSDGTPVVPQPDPIEVAVGVIDNSNEGPVVDMTGPVALFYGDFLDSVNNTGFQFGVFDNLRVTVPRTVLWDFNNEDPGTLPVGWTSEWNINKNVAPNCDASDGQNCDLQKLPWEAVNGRLQPPVYVDIDQQGMDTHTLSPVFQSGDGNASGSGSTGGDPPLLSFSLEYDSRQIGAK